MFGENTARVHVYKEASPMSTIDVWAGNPLKEGTQKYLFSYEAYDLPEKGSLLTDPDHLLDDAYWLKVKQVVHLSSDANRFWVYVKAAK